jgi:poly(3-hydroxybutyrate) depolymerase
MSYSLRRLAAATTVLLFFGATLGEAPVKKTLEQDGGRRTYYLFGPADLSSEQEVPLLLTFHGSRRRGHSLVTPWIELAAREGFVVAGLDSANPVGWAFPDDGADLIEELVEEVAEEYPIDRQRVYLFGHSAGAGCAILLALLEPGYFAAAVMSGGSLPVGQIDIRITAEERKVPMLLLLGGGDLRLDHARLTQNILGERGFSIELRELVTLGHDYYSESRYINDAAWDFLKQHRLEFPPYFTLYDFGPPEPDPD